jgi:hypothetical protein
MKRRAWNIHERFLRHIWSKQYLKNKLATADGRALTVLHVGQLNSDGGPDFLNAKVRVGNITYAGDIEIHRTTFDWFQHQHQEDPRYNKVVLHVVLETGYKFSPTLVKSGREIPVLVLGNFLSESIHTIWQKAILDERVKKSGTIRCFNNNDALSSELIDCWLTKLAVERLELKLRRFEERLKQLAHEKRMMVRERQRPYGEPPLEGEHDEIPPPLPELTQKDFSQKELWEQVLYEGVMEGLGYSKNREPFVRLAQSVTLKMIGDLRTGNGGDRIQSLLFGVAGLIPKLNSLKEKESRDYVRRLAREWKVLRPSFHYEIIHLADWQFFPTRPSNFPTLRMAAACALINKFFSDDLFRHIIQTIKTSSSEGEKERELIRLFSTETNDFWKHHYNFDEAAPKNVTALGTMRIREIIINAVLPVTLLYARIFKDKTVRECALRVYLSLPATEDNSITRFMEKQLLKGRHPQEHVSHQQAVIQLYKYYCSEGRCPECELGQKLFV